MSSSISLPVAFKLKQAESKLGMKEFSTLSHIPDWKSGLAHAVCTCTTKMCKYFAIIHVISQYKMYVWSKLLVLIKKLP